MQSDRRIALGILGLVLLVWPTAPASSADQLGIDITYLAQEVEKLPPLSLLDPVEIPDEGLAGARLGQEDNQTTGSFLGHDYRLHVEMVSRNGDPVATAEEILAGGVRLLVVDAAADQLLAIADLAAGEGTLMFNVDAPDDRLRTDECRANLFHNIPSRAMKTDGLAQYLVWKRWRSWMLLHGTKDSDLAFKEALERAADKFGAKIAETRACEYEATARRTDSGHVQVQRQLPVFTQNAADHDVIVVADQSDVFGEYLPYRTWDADPVTGTHGLKPTAWHRSPEGMGVSPDGKTVVNTFETTNMAHFIDTETHAITDNVLVDQRPRFAQSIADGVEVWIAAEIGGTVSVIDDATRTIKQKIIFAIPGVPDEAIQPVGVRILADRSKAYVALGPRTGSRWSMPGATRCLTTFSWASGSGSSPDEQMLYSTNGVSNDISVIDACAGKVVKSIAVGRLPWGVAVKD